jgi:hypothetical protein
MMPHMLGSSGTRRVVTLTLLSVGISATIFASFASADLPGVVMYRGIHPRFPHNGAFCYIDVTHVHHKRPTDLRVYRVLPNEEHLFVGDPVSLGYVGPTRAYFGPHPLAFPGVPPSIPVHCYLRGPHFHAQESQPSSPSFVAKNDVYWFMGTFPPEFERDRHYLWINDTWAIGSYHPPPVTLSDAPNGYRFPAVAEVRTVPLLRSASSPSPPSRLARKTAAKGGKPATEGSASSNHRTGAR